MYRPIRNRHAGTSMVELLVVIVIFLIGILAVVQIFPGGFSVLRTTRSNTVASQLIRTEMERLKGRTDQLAEMILPVRFVYDGGTGKVNFVADPDRGPNNLGPAGDQIRPDGVVLDGNDPIGPWQYVSGSNVARRVIGEGGTVPAPRAVGNLFGGLMVLQFAPIVYNADPVYAGLLSVYGNDMNKRDGAPGFRPPRPWEYFLEDVEDPAGTIYLPADRTQTRKYVLWMTAWVNNGSVVEKRELVDISVTVPPDPSGVLAVPLNTLVAGSFIGADWDSIRCARQFLEVGTFSGDPYEYVLVDATLGTMVFSPSAYNYTETRRGRKIPLTARVDYDVYDWRIIRDEFRIPEGLPARQKLRVGSLYVPNRNQPDGKPWPGMNIFVPVGSAVQRDIILLDMETGGLVDRSDYAVDAIIGLITFNDADNDPNNGLQVDVEIPGAGFVRMSATGRHIRAMYQVVGEWSIQVSKAASRYRTALGRPGIGQCYPSGLGAYYGWGSIGGEVNTRIYFPAMDDGQKVTIGEIWYGQPGQEPQLLADEEFLIRSAPADPTGLPYVDITDKLGAAVQPLNYTRYGYAVKNVKGATVDVKALWNPTAFKLGQDLDDNIRIFEKWMQSWRHTSTTTFLVKEEK